MDDTELLIDTYRCQATASVRAKLDALLDLERLRDPRVVPLLLEVLDDRREPMAVRIHILKRLRNGELMRDYRPAIAEAMLRLLSNRSGPDLRLESTLALAHFTNMEGVLAALGGIALDPLGPIDLRYSAFTSLQQAGPTPECVSLLRQLSADEMLGPAAVRVLSSWRIQ
jgi:PBS lyase HEAT-like repeat-containing protein